MSSDTFRRFDDSIKISDNSRGDVNEIWAALVKIRGAAEITDEI